MPKKMSPSQRSAAVLDEAIAKRKAAAPKGNKPASETAGKKLPAAESFNRMPAVSKPSPNRAGSTYTPGSKADMAYAGLKPKRAPAKAPAATSTPKPYALREPVKAPEIPVRKPRLTTGKLVGLGLAVNAGQAAYYEVKRRKNKDKK